MSNINADRHSAGVLLLLSIYYEQKMYMTFGTFWSSSKSKRATAIMLVMNAFGTCMGYFTIFPNQTEETDEIAADSGGLTTTIATETTTPYNIPEI